MLRIKNTCRNAFKIYHFVFAKGSDFDQIDIVSYNVKYDQIDMVSLQCKIQESWFTVT